MVTYRSNLPLSKTVVIPFAIRFHTLSGRDNQSGTQPSLSVPVNAAPNGQTLSTYEPTFLQTIDFFQHILL